MSNRRANPSRAARIGPVDVAKRVEQLVGSLARIELALQRAESKIEADARARIRRLHDDASRRLAILAAHQREASRLLRQLSTANRGAWGVLTRAANRELRAAHAAGDAMLVRFRTLAGGARARRPS